MFRISTGKVSTGDPNLEGLKQYYYCACVLQPRSHRRQGRPGIEEVCLCVCVCSHMSGVSGMALMALIFFTMVCRSREVSL